MSLSSEQVEEFRKIYFNKYGKEISFADAQEQAEKLLRLMMLIYKPMAIEDYDAIQKQRLKELPDIIKMIVADPDQE